MCENCSISYLLSNVHGLYVATVYPESFDVLAPWIDIAIKFYCMNALLEYLQFHTWISRLVYIDHYCNIVECSIRKYQLDLTQHTCFNTLTCSAYCYAGIFKI